MSTNKDFFRYGRNTRSNLALWILKLGGLKLHPFLDHEILKSYLMSSHQYLSNEELHLFWVD